MSFLLCFVGIDVSGNFDESECKFSTVTLRFFLLYFWAWVLMRSPGMRGIMWWYFRMHKAMAMAPFQNQEGAPPSPGAARSAGAGCGL